MKTEQLIDILAEDLPTRPARAAATLGRWLPLATAGLLALWLTIVGVRPDIMSSGLWPTAAKLLLGVLLATIGVTGAVRLSRPEARASDGVRWLALVPVLVLITIGAELSNTGVRGWQVRLFGQGVAPCLLTIPALAVVPLVVSLVALRHGATSAPGATGALAGLGAAGLAIMAYGLWCTEDSMLFVGVWYLMASLIAALVGALAARATLRW